MRQSFHQKAKIEQKLTPAIEALVSEAKQSGMSFDDLLSAIMSWALDELHEGEEFSGKQAAVLKILETSLIKEYEIKASIKGAAARR